jgi:dephospho-CoA kinase
VPQQTKRVPIVVDPDAAWQEQGAELAAGLRRALGSPALYVDHIGSTAIPGMAAKPVFDLQVTVRELDAAVQAFDRPLAALGFQAQAHIRSDHVPAGSGDDPARWTKRLWSRRDHVDPDSGPAPDANLHVRLTGSPNERLALLFRDWFRAHPEAIPAYAWFKRELAGAVADIGVYSDVKDPVVDLVIAIAEPWAAATGWTPHGPV